MTGPLLRFDFPSSPLLSSSSSETVFSSAVLNRIPTLPLPHSAALGSTTSLSTALTEFSLRTPMHLVRAVPHITITRPASDRWEDKPLPPLPSPSPAPKGIPFNLVMSVLEFLERNDRDMASELQRVRRNIQEAEREISEWKQERRLRDAEFADRQRGCGGRSASSAGH